jgi:hypothetical protein
MKAAGTSETLEIFYQTTRRYDPGDNKLRTCCHQNLKSYINFTSFAGEIFFCNIDFKLCFF